MSMARESTEIAVGRQPNTVALIGVVLLALAIALCGLLIAMLEQLPADKAGFREAVVNTPTQLRMLVVAISMGVLNIIALLLCAIGLFLPNRQRGLAVTGTIGSLLLLLGVFGVVGIGLTLNTDKPMAAPTATEGDA